MSSDPSSARRPNYTIIPCRLSHIAEIARTIRAEDRAEIEGVGLHVRHLLVALYRGSLYRRAALVDGEVAAVWGDSAPLISTEGAMWAVTAPVIERVPLAFFREARREIAERLQVRSVLRADVADSYTAALRFYRLLGFEIGARRPLPPAGTLYREISIERR